MTQPTLTPDVAEALLGLLDLVSIPANLPDLVERAQLLAKAREQLQAVASFQPPGDGEP